MANEQALLAQEDRITNLEFGIVTIAAILAESPNRDVRCDLVLWIADFLSHLSGNPQIDAAKYPDLKRFVDSI